MPLLCVPPRPPRLCVKNVLQGSSQPAQIPSARFAGCGISVLLTLTQRRCTIPKMVKSVGRLQLPHFGRVEDELDGNGVVVDDDFEEMDGLGPSA